MSRQEHTISVSHTMVVSYECENCNKLNSMERRLDGLAVTHTVGGPKDHMLSREVKEKLTAIAQKDLDRKKQEVLDEKDYGSERCPACGYYQSWMVGKAKKTRVHLITWGICIPLMLIGMAMMHFAEKEGSLYAVGVSIMLGSLLLAAPIYFICKKKVNLNKGFGNIERKNEPTVSWKYGDTGANPLVRL